MALQRAITQADLDANPVLAELGGIVGDTVSIFHPEDPSEQVEIVEATVDPQPAQ